MGEKSYVTETGIWENDYLTDVFLPEYGGTYKCTAIT